jgi:peptidoglycan-associated lipoprotein
MRALQLYAILITVTAACSHSKPKLAAPPAPTGTAAAQPATPVEPAKAAVSPGIAASPDLLAQCKLQLESATKAPKFGYDEFDLLPADRDVLDQVAQCVTKGPLHGKALRLTGRADPRGSQEYNLALGTKRAGTVASYLERLGVPTVQLVQTTRGDLDAKGVDETSWQQDRRVDLDLAR